VELGSSGHLAADGGDVGEGLAEVGHRCVTLYCKVNLDGAGVKREKPA
jgi:hypothetical protein